MAIRILLAEDHPIHQKVAQLMLKRAGYAVDAVWDGNGRGSRATRED